MSLWQAIKPVVPFGVGHAIYRASEARREQDSLEETIAELAECPSEDQQNSWFSNYVDGARDVFWYGADAASYVVGVHLLLGEPKYFVSAIGIVIARYIVAIGAEWAENFNKQESTHMREFIAIRQASANE